MTDVNAERIIEDMQAPTDTPRPAEATEVTRLLRSVVRLCVSLSERLDRLESAVAVTAERHPETSAR